MRTGEGILGEIKNRREDILTGEIGALLHDIGKCHPKFIKKNSSDNGYKNFHHTDIDGFLKIKLLSLIKNNKFNITINTESTTVYSIIRNHHSDINDDLINLLKSCDRLDSADDKGIVRKKQSIGHVIISSPFGYPKEKIDLEILQKRLDDLSDNLIGLFENYISNSISLSCFREGMINNLETTFSHALGETRIPSNDVTLWDHSHSTASLFKSILCSIALGGTSGSPNLQWRILGFCWDGYVFVNRGKKVADILKRNEIITVIQRKLKIKFEDRIPIGNTIYADVNGIYFTFPELEDGKSIQLAEECAKIGLKIIRDESNNEIWPFFTLSIASRTLTTIADELNFASEKRNVPKMSPTLFIDGKSEGIGVANNPEVKMPSTNESKDICPVCRIRTKSKDSMCNICETRRKGRLQYWLFDRASTIWIDEVADKNNRIALLTLNFDIDKWLDGTMVSTIYSQSFEDWMYGKGEDNTTKSINDALKELREEIKEKIGKIDEVIEGMRKAKIPPNDKIREKFKEKLELQELLKIFEMSLNPNKSTVYQLLCLIIDLKNIKIIKKAIKEQKLQTPLLKILSTFYQDITIDKRKYENLERRLQTQWDKENLATHLFTQNPSPARLYRIWKEIEEFFDLIIQKLKYGFYSTKWEMIRFIVDENNLKLKYGVELKLNEPYIIEIEGLDPKNLLILHTSNGEFYTIESVEKFKFGDKNSVEAIEHGLKEIGFHNITEEEKPDENILEEQPVKISKLEVEKYNPFIEITKSPISLRLIVPASDSIKILNLITKLYNERFQKVIGKLPLNAGLLVAKRKFPLYVLLEAGERMLIDKGFKAPEEMDLWWNVTELGDDMYYDFYPIRELRKNEKYTLDDLSEISKGRLYALYPGYFDFDLLIATTDRYGIRYKDNKRYNEDYRLLSSRPLHFYKISNMIDLWEILYNNLSNSEINFIEEMLSGKLREWRDVKDYDKKIVVREFAEATLKDAFADKWEKLRRETRYFILNSALDNLLLDTIILFRHTIKEARDNE